MAKYDSVNGAWPEGTNQGRDIKPTPQEAMSAARRLYRLALAKPFRGKVRLTSGRRYTWVRNGVMHVNPDCRGGGWHELVHDLSHYCAYRLHPRAKAHSTQHAFLERQMIDHVVRSGWLEGKLRREPKAAKPRDVKAERYQRTLDKIARWETKRKRAETALRKLYAAKRRYEKQAAPSGARSSDAGAEAKSRQPLAYN